jgi:hypothetical protein
MTAKLGWVRFICPCSTAGTASDPYEDDGMPQFHDPCNSSRLVHMFVTINLV